MEGGVGGEQVEHQLATQHRTNGDAGIEKVLRPQVAAQVHHNQGPTPQLRQPACCLGDLADGACRSTELFLGIAQQHGQTAGAQQFHQAPQLPLPKDGQGERTGHDERVHQLCGEGQVGEALDEPGHRHQKQPTPEQPEGALLVDAGKKQKADGRGKENVEHKARIHHRQHVHSALLITAVNVTR